MKKRISSEAMDSMDDGFERSRSMATRHDGSGSRDVLTDVLREGAQKLLADAIQLEVEEYLQQRSHLLDEKGHRLVVRNGSLPEREILTGLGPIAVQQPRVRDNRPFPEREEFTSSLLPKYLRKTKSIEEMIPWLYLKGISTGGFQEALQSLLGPDCPGLSASTVNRLTTVWQEEYDEWAKRDLTGKHYVFLWADGIHSNVRLEADRQCLLVLMGATPDGTKELIAVRDGYRESELSWKELLLDLKSRGLVIAPKLAIGDGALGFWKALRQVFPTTREQRCTVHKTANVLDKLPKTVQPQAKRMLHAIWDAPSRQQGETAFDLFINTFEAKYQKAVDCLRGDRTELMAFYDFPAETWCHIRTTNPIESTFATIRLRHRKTKGNGSARASLAMMFKLAQSAAKGWRKLRGHKLIPDLIKGIRFIDGIDERTIKPGNQTLTDSAA